MSDSDYAGPIVRISVKVHIGGISRPNTGELIVNRQIIHSDHLQQICQIADDLTKVLREAGVTVINSRR